VRDGGTGSTRARPIHRSSSTGSKRTSRPIFRYGTRRSSTNRRTNRPVTPKRAAKHIEKVLRSAIANAERKAEDAGAPLDVDELYVAQCFVNEGSRWKRLRPAPMGRGFRYQKRTAHLWVQVAEHHVAAAERHATIVAEAEANKGVRGTARRVRKALTGKSQPPKKGKKG